MQRKVAKLQSKLVKPKYTLRQVKIYLPHGLSLPVLFSDPTKLRTVKKATNQKRKSTDKAENEETKRSRSSIGTLPILGTQLTLFLDFDEVANVETTKTAEDVPMTTNAQNQTA